MKDLLLYTFVALVAVGALYGLALLFLSAREQMAPAVADRPPWGLREDVLGPNDVVGVRLPVALRGYRFAETDLLLDRLTEELQLRDEEIARLRAGGSAPDDAFARPAVDPYSAPTYSAAPDSAGPVPASPIPAAAALYAPSPQPYLQPPVVPPTIAAPEEPPTSGW